MLCGITTFYGKKYFVAMATLYTSVDGKMAERAQASTSYKVKIQ